MHFRLKIFTATLAILLFTLVLNSVLSISSFEKIYSRSLVSIMESRAVNLKQDIERGILLGKPLDAFEGMDDMLAQFLDSNPRVENVAVSMEPGEIIYFKGAEENGSSLLARHAQEFEGQEEPHAVFDRDRYILYLPIVHRAEQQTHGGLLLSFSQAVILERITQMIKGALNRLGWSLGGTALVLVGLLGLFVVRPIRKDLVRIRQALLPFTREHETAGTQNVPHEEADSRLSPVLKDAKTHKAGPAAPGSGRTPLTQKFPDSRIIRNDILSLGSYLQEIALELESRGKEAAESPGRSLKEIADGLESCSSELAWHLENEEIPHDLRLELEQIIRDSRQAAGVLGETKEGRYASGFKEPSADTSGRGGGL
ncbi:hypothetical protein [Desulfonatronospira sp. MSAO_Bac3]|uniref:hypothetical protein n=1 Tax=Desulfonatronospira sp. MSAO_Bac3 TaxID=2293857 RepID=UPI000FEF0B2B|nr:hypothetical protein [Desulfonatronospira sp. MSAO_Bac3]RQD76257.1 MAG: hypothetical protein D5S03_06780 [Desulfonatronospira sp. MSAO_Bac3]